MSVSYHIRFLSFGTQHEAPDKYETGKADATGTTKRFSNQVRVYPPKKVVVSIGEWSSDHGRGGAVPESPAGRSSHINSMAPVAAEETPPRKVVPVPHCRSCRHRTEEGIHLVYARGGVWLRAFGFTPQRFRMTDISGQESLAVLPEEKAPTRSPSKPQIRPAIYHPQKRTSIRSPKAATSRISADGYRRTSGNTNGGQPNNPKYTAVSSFRSSSTLRDAWAISATQNRKPRIFGRGCPRTGTLPSLKIGAPQDKGREGQPPVKYTMPFDSRP